MIECEICNTMFPSYSSLSNHIRQTHKIDSHTYFDTYIKKQNDNICLICGKPTKFLGLHKGYRTYCSKKCASNDPNIIQKTQNTNIIKYGVSNPMNQEKCQKQAKLTKLQKYGTEQSLKSDIVREKIKSTNKIRYGNENIFASNYGKKKIKETMQEKYGVDNAVYLPGNLEKLNSKEATEKSIETKRKNGTFNTSKPEDEAYEELVKIFGTVKRQYKSEVYPFLCDFYIPSEDLYIELNLHWTHGFHWFDENSKEDQETLEKWKEKAKNSKYYQYAINTWTIRDVEKRQIVEENKVNYLVFWSKQNFYNYIKEIGVEH